MGSLENFHSWTPELARYRRVLIPDLPGCGETALGHPPYTVPAQARFLQAFAERLGLGRHDAGGICLGATVALEYAQQAPNVVTRLILHTPVYSPKTVRPRFAWQVRAFTSQPLFEAIAGLRRNRLVSDLYKRWFVEGPGVDAYDAQINFANQCRADARAAREWLRDAVRRDYCDFLASWGKPVLIVVAADDRTVDVGAIRGLRQLIPQADIRVIESAGHGWTPQLIAAQVEAIARFVAQ